MNKLSKVLSGVVLTGIACFCVTLYVNQAGERHKFDTILNLTSLKHVRSEYINLIQQERGLTLGFSKSDPSFFEKEIQLVNEQYAELKKRHTLDSETTPITERLKDIRQSATNGVLTDFQVFAQYSQLITDLADAEVQRHPVFFVLTQDNSRPQKTMTFVRDLGRAQELAGQLRAQVSRLINQTESIQAKYHQAAHLSKKLSKTLSRITYETKRQNIDHVVHPAILDFDASEAGRILNDILAGDQTGDKRHISRDWWRAQTNFINALFYAEQTLLSSMSSYARLNHQKTVDNTYLILILFVFCIGSLVTLIISLWRYKSSNEDKNTGGNIQMPILPVAMTVISIFAVSSTYYLSNWRNGQILQVGATLHRLNAEQNKALHTDWVANIDSLIAEWSSFPEMEGLLSNADETLIKQIERTIRPILNVLDANYTLIKDTSGKPILLVSVDTEAQGANVKNLPDRLWKDILAGERVIGPILEAGNGQNTLGVSPEKKIAMHFGAPIFDLNDDVIGGIVMEVMPVYQDKPAEFEGMLVEHQIMYLGDLSTSVLSDALNELTRTYDTGIVVNSNLLALDASYYAWRWLADTDQAVITRASSKTVEQAFYMQIGTTIGVGAFLLGIPLMALNVVSRRQTKAYQTLADSEAMLQREKNKAEDALKEVQTTRTLLQHAVSGVPAHVALLDESGEILLLNEQWEHETSIFISNNEEQNQSTTQIVKVGDNLLTLFQQGLFPGSTVRSIKQVTEGRETSFSSEIRIRCTQAETQQWVFLLIKNIGYLEKKLSVIFIEDISARKNSEAKLAEAKRAAEASNIAKSRFLATMSHEIRTPMNGVVGMLDLLAQSPLNSEQRQLSSIAKDSTLALMRIIDDILDFSKIEAGKLEFDPQPFSLSGLLKDVAELLGNLALDKQLKFMLWQEADVSDQQVGDITRVRQVLLNLVGNALKFTSTDAHKQGIVNIFVSCNLKQNQIFFKVTDNGIGIDEEALGNLFKPFIQADNSVQREFGGTGLGLSICQRLIDMMGGSISVNSSLGVGTEFLVALPNKPTNQQPAEARSLIDVSVAFMDHGEVYLDQMQTVLEQQGARCTRVDGLSSTALSRIQHANVVVYGSRLRDKLLREQRDIELDSMSVRQVLITQDSLFDSSLLSPSTVVLIDTPLYAQKVIHAVSVAAGISSPDISPQMLEKCKSRPLLDIETAENKGKLVLVAEDNIYNQEVLKRQLANLGYTCLVASDGVEALHLMESHNFGLLITDCHMPNMDGFTLTKRVRENATKHNKQHIPIIAATANALSGVREKCLAAGMDDFITKPMELKTLQKILHAWLAIDESTASVTSDKDQTKAQHLEVKQCLTKENVSTIDLHLLSEFVGPNKSLQEKFMQQYVSSTRPLFDELFAALNTKSHSVAKDLAHQLKSASRTVGASTLAEQLETLERYVELEASENYAEMKDSIGEHYQSVLFEIDRLVA